MGEIPCRGQKFLSAACSLPGAQSSSMPTQEPSSPGRCSPDPYAKRLVVQGGRERRLARLFTADGGLVGWGPG